MAIDETELLLGAGALFILYSMSSGFAKTINDILAVPGNAVRGAENYVTPNPQTQNQLGSLNFLTTPVVQDINAPGINLAVGITQTLNSFWNSVTNPSGFYDVKSPGALQYD